MSKYHQFNFFKHTFCEFKSFPEEFFKEKSIHFKSKSGSKYFYTEQGVYRYSNHWGRVANCRWKIKGIQNYKNQNYYYGYANWKDFYSLNSSEKEFYLDVDYSQERVTICKAELNTTKFLMTLNFSLKRIKEIKNIFKENKWASYINEDVDEVKTVLIKKMVSSDRPLQELKQSLRDIF